MITILPTLEIFKMTMSEITDFDYIWNWLQLLETWGGSFFTLKLAYAFFANNRSFWLILGQYFQKFDNYGPFGRFNSNIPWNLHI